MLPFVVVECPMSRCPSLALLPRRAVLAGLLAALAGPTAAMGEPLAAAELSASGREVRRLASLLWTAIQAEIDAEETPAYEAACERAEALQAQFNTLAEEVLAQPVRSWPDVVTRAEIAQAYSPGFSLGRDGQALKSLLEAVLVMGGRHV
jgi:hypothetical protein